MVGSEQSDGPEVPDDYSIAYLDILKDRLDLARVPFTERGSRILVEMGQGPSSNGSKREGQSVGLDVRMAERWTHLQKRLGNHRTRRPLIENLQPTDHSGHPLPFTLTTWPHRLLLQTSLGSFEILFADKETLYVCLPEARCGLSFSVMAEQYLPDEHGGILDGARRLALTSDSPSARLRVTGEAEERLFFALESHGGARNVLAIHLPQSTDCLREVRSAESVRQQAERAWNSWFEAAPKVSQRYWPEYYYAWMILRSGLLSPAGYLKREALAPSKTHYLGIWHWDAYFHALAYRHVDAQLAQDQLWALLDYQSDNGMIPDVVHDEGLITREDDPGGRELTKPPLMAWSALRLFEGGGGSAFLQDMYEPLVRWNNWWLEHCDDDGDGVVQYNHPYSSGLDDSPLWDAGMPVESPDLNTYLCIHMQSLATIARLIGRHDDGENWDRQARDLARRAGSHFYDRKSGVFWATKDHSPIRVLTPFNLLPIWTGYLSRRQAHAVMSTLTSKNTFWTEFGIPTVSRSDSCYDPERMWRGPTWINVNYMLIEALSRVGYHSLAANLADRTVDLIGRSGIAEYFNSATGDVPARAAPAFGWSAALFVDLLIRRTRDRQLSPWLRFFADGFASY